MIKVKDGYAKLIGTTYQGSATLVLLSNGGNLEFSSTTKANTLVLRNASLHIYATYFNSAISDEALTDIGSVYVRNTSDTFIRRISKTQFYSIIDNKFVTLDTALTITGVKTFSTGPILANNATITLNLNSTSNYTTVVKWLKGGTSLGTYNPSIGQHNTGGDGTGSICILPYPTSTDPWGGTVGLFISKGVLRLDGKAVAIAENYYTKTELDGRYVNVTGDTMTGPLIVKASITGTLLISNIANGTSPLKVTSKTVVTNLNSDLLDGYHASSFESYRLVVIDASGLNNNTWYPVTMVIGNSLQTRIRIEGYSNANATWNNRSDNCMALILDYTVNGSEWGWTGVSRAIHRYEEGAGTSSCLRGLGQLTNSSTEYVYVRGGAKYNFYVSRFITPVIRTSTYTSNSLSVSPTTSAPAAISTPTLTFAAGKFSALSYKPITGVNTVYIPTNTSHLTNDSGFWTGTRYWANIAVSTSPSTNTSPTFNTSYALIHQTSSQFYLKTGDATMKIYSNISETSNYGSEGIAILTTFDGLDPTSSSYPSNYPSRAVLQLLPRGGNVSIGRNTAPYRLTINGDLYASRWLRTESDKGWYSETYGGGIHMSDSTWVRVYNGKSFYCDNAIQAGHRFYTGYDSGQSKSMSCSNWFRSNNSTGWLNATYGGGWYMTESNYVRVWNNKAVHTGNQNHYAFNSAGGYYSSWSNSYSLNDSNTLNHTYATFNKSLVTVLHNTVQPQLVWSNVVSIYGYITRYSISSIRPSNGAWGRMRLAVGNTDSGDRIGTYLDIDGNGGVYTGSKMYARGFVHRDMVDNNYILLAGGGYKSLSGLSVDWGNITGKPSSFGLVKYWAIYKLSRSEGSSSMSYSKISGNFNFITSTGSKQHEGRFLFMATYPSGFNQSNTMIFGNGQVSNTNDWTKPCMLTILKDTHDGRTRFIIIVSDDASPDRYASQVYLQFLCIS